MNYPSLSLGNSYLKMTPPPGRSPRLQGQFRGGRARNPAFGPTQQEARRATLEHCSTFAIDGAMRMPESRVHALILAL